LHHQISNIASKNQKSYNKTGEDYFLSLRCLKDTDVKRKCHLADIYGHESSIYEDTLGILVSLKKGFEGRKRGDSEVKRRALCVFC